MLNFVLNRQEHYVMFHDLTDLGSWRQVCVLELSTQVMCHVFLDEDSVLTIFE